jgi:hypothetical protein
MRERPKTNDLLPEDLEALGLTQDRIMQILIGPSRGVPPPPEGYPPLTQDEVEALSDKERQEREERDPRRDMSLDKSKYFVAPGESIRIEFDRGATGMGREVDIWERYILSFPSGHVTKELDTGDAGRILMGMGFSHPQMTDILKKAQSYRNTVLWPNEGLHLVVVKGANGKEYFS